jgi:hypothetical protein
MSALRIGQVVAISFGMLWTFSLALTMFGGSNSDEATVGAGIGANVLIDGSTHTIALQPVSLQGQAGLNVTPCALRRQAGSAAGGMCVGREASAPL